MTTAILHWHITNQIIKGSKGSNRNRHTVNDRLKDKKNMSLWYETLKQPVLSNIAGDLKKEVNISKSEIQCGNFYPGVTTVIQRDLCTVGYIGT